MEPGFQGHHFGATSASDHAVVHQGDQTHHHKTSQYNMGIAHHGDQYNLGPSIHFYGTDVTMGDATSTTSSTTHFQPELRYLKRRADQISIDSPFVNTVSEWLAPAGQFNYHENIRSNVHEDTGKWVFENPMMVQWLSHQKQTLALSGMAGCGKTCLASVIIDGLALRNPDDTLVLFFYSSFKRQNEQGAREMMASLLQQAFQADPLKAMCVVDLYRSHRRLQTKATTTELVASLCAVTNQYQQTVIIFDAFDECVCAQVAQYSQRNKFWECLISVQQNSLRNVSIMVTARPNLGPRTGVSLRLDIQAHPEDIAAYVSQRLQYADNTAHLSSSLCEQIQERIIDRSSGMFLLAKLFTDNVVSMTSTRAIWQSLENISKDAAAEEVQQAAYNTTLDRIKGGKHKDLASRAIACAVFCQRPIRVEELRHAVSVKFAMEDMNDDDLDHLQAILDASAGLLQVDKFSDVIQLVHYTAQQYFECLRDPEWFGLYRNYLGEACIKYLSMQGLVDEIVYNQRLGPPRSAMPYIGPPRANDDAQPPDQGDSPTSPRPKDDQLHYTNIIFGQPRHMAEVLHFYPFAGYALEFWSRHLRDLGPEAPRLESLDFLQTKEVAQWVIHFHPAHTCHGGVDRTGFQNVDGAKSPSTDDIQNLESLERYLTSKHQVAGRIGFICQAC